MAQIFHPSTNTFSKVSIFGAVFFLGTLLWAWDAFNRSAYMTQVGVARDQPVPFSHRHHVDDLGIDCRYCHTSVEESRFAGIPSSKTCMTCHSQLFATEAMLEPVRESYRTDRSIEWTRVHDLPDFAYFDHSIHLAKGIGCSSCHGRVDHMPLTWQVNTLQMAWCLECHREPERFVRPKEHLFDMEWEPGPDQIAQGLALMNEYGARVQTHCSTCHR